MESRGEKKDMSTVYNLGLKHKGISKIVHKYGYDRANGLYVSILTLLEPGTEATDADLSMLDDIYQEFMDFADEMKRGLK
jgi:hypothetical protein